MSSGSTRAEPPTVGAEGSLAELVHAHFRYIWRLLRRLGLPAADADDGAQQVFLAASTRLADIHAGSERAFLYGTALNIAGKWRRAARRQADLEPALDDAPSDAPGPDDVVDQRKARAVLDELLLRLPMELRAVFVLYEIEQLTAAEIAEITTLPLGTVASRLRRAREEFTEHVRRLEARMTFEAARAGKVPR